jgi:hypothetical protein
MKRRDISITTHSSTIRPVLYDLLVDSASWPDWSPLDSVTLERPGDASREGVGAIRVNRRGRTVGRDEVVELLPNTSFRYRTLSGVPVREYVGEVRLEDAPGGGTTVTWHSSFLPKWRGTGWLVERGLRRFLARCTHGLVEYAARQPTPR